MARFYGAIGYAESVEKPVGSGVWVDDITEYYYTGNVIRNSRRMDPGEQLNDDIAVVNRISIIANQFANQHFYKIKYLEWMGVRWTVTSVDVQPPRLILSLGSVYNGPTP